MNFEDCIPYILKFEGEYSFDPKDPGGETKYGISKRFYPNVDIKNLTVQQAKDIYKKDYWDANGIEFLPPDIRLAFFDTCVNMGAYRAKILIQRTVRVREDAAIGPETLQAIRRYGPELLAHFLSERALKYASTNGFDYFGRGWMKRIFAIATIRGKFS